MAFTNPWDEYERGPRGVPGPGTDYGYDPPGPKQGPPAPPPQQQVGACPDNTPNGPAPCCPAGTVWRKDTKSCEAPDQRSREDRDTCPAVGPGHGGSPGPGWWCDFDTMEWKKGYDPGTGGGQRNTGGGGGAPRVTAVPGQAQADQIWAAIQARLAGPSRYTPEVMSGLVGSIKDRAERAASLQMEENQGELAKRNILRSSIAVDDARDIRGKVGSAVMAEQNRVNIAKVEADYADKTAAIQEGLAWLNSLRSYVAQSAATAASREVGLANIALGEQRLRQEMDMIRETYQQKLQFCVLFPATCGEGL